MKATRRRAVWRLARQALVLTLCLQPLAPAHAGEQTLKLTVELRGLSDELRDNALAFLSIDDLADALNEAVGEAGLMQARRRVEQAHRRAPAELANALQPFGYYSPDIDGELSAGPPWTARYRIDQGPRTRVSAVELELVGDGMAVESIAVAAQRFRELQGKSLRHARYQARKSALQSSAVAAGYLDAAYQALALEVDPASQSAIVAGRFDTGPLWSFGAIEIKQEVLRDSFVQRYHAIEPGQPFDAQRLVQLQLALNDSGYFDHVELDVRRSDARDGRIPVTVSTQPAKRQRYSAGAGFGTDTGPRVKAGLETRRVNRRGHSYRIDTRLSAIRSTLRAEYRVPFKNIASDAWRFQARADRAEIADADSTQYVVGVAREDSWGSVRRRLFANVERERFAFGDAPSSTSTLVYPGLTLSLGSLDNARFVRRGYSLTMTALMGADALGSDVDFASLRIGARSVLPLGSSSRLLLASELGYLDTSEFADLPPSQRFFAGGDRSVRGYRFESISPVNAAGDDIGGDHLATFSVEADHFFAEQWGIAAFADVGSSSLGSPTDWRSGAGVGLRYRSPVGMIRLDLAHPLDDPDTAVRIHLSIGPDL